MNKVCFITPELRRHIPKLKMPAVFRHSDEEGKLARTDGRSPVLIVTYREDRTSAYFGEFIAREGYRAHKMYLDDLFNCREFNWDNVSNAFSRLGRPIYFRASWSDDHRLNRVVAMIHDILALYPYPVINRPSQLSLNLSKPLQTAALLKDRRGAVRAVPTTLTNCAARLHAAQPEATIVKSISCLSSEVVALSDQRLQQENRSLNTPVQLQPRLSGLNIRAHVCGSNVFAVQVKSDRIDYRSSESAEIESANLPPDIASWCIEAARREGLEFAGIDLLYDPTSHHYHCFEINPSPGYHYYEQRLVDRGERPVISECLLQHLLG